MNCGVRLGGVGPGGFSGSLPATRSHKNWRLKDAKVETGSSTTSGGPVEEPSTSGRKGITQGDVEHVATAIHMCQKLKVPVASVASFVASWFLKDYVDLFLNRDKRRETKVLKNKIAIGELQKVGVATVADVQKVGVAVEEVRKMGVANKIAIGELQKVGVATGADVQKVGVAVEELRKMGVATVEELRKMRVATGADVQKVGVAVEEVRGGIKKLTESVEKLDIRMGKLEKGARRKF